MLLLGIDLGTSSIKVSVVEAESRKCIVSVQYPETESEIISLRTGWAEQSPGIWWENIQRAILKANSTGLYNSYDISAIGISYQMHGLVAVDEEQNILRNSIIWCDSRAVEIGNAAFDAIGHEQSLSRLLNSPGNFTATKLAWIKKNEPDTYQRIYKVMLPGDFIAMKLTGEITTTVSALSEGVFWDFKANEVSQDILKYFDFDPRLLPDIFPVFSEHGQVKTSIAEALALKTGIPVSYKSGDQPNNALSLNVLKPGEVAATAGTSGVIYGISDKLTYDKQSRVNTFAHVNYTNEKKRLGVLLCINGTGILNRWVRDIFASNLSYSDMNTHGKKVKIGSDGLKILPFGNGAERMLNNKIVGTHFHHIDLNLHQPAHIFRAVQEGIAFAFRYGLDIMRENNMHPALIRAGRANMFLSELFTEAFVNATNVPVQFLNNDGSVGAALGAGIGSKQYTSPEDAFSNIKLGDLIEPAYTEEYETVYQEWKALLKNKLINTDN